MSEHQFTDEDADRMVAEGLFEFVGVDENGERLYRLTPLGEARAESFIQTVEGADLWTRLSSQETPE